MPSATLYSRTYVNLKLLGSQLSFAGMTLQIAEQAGGSDVGSSVAAAILSCAEMFRCALIAASLLDSKLVFGGEIRGF
jgi:hypothetical protein